MTEKISVQQPSDEDSGSENSDNKQLNLKMGQKFEDTSPCKTYRWYMST